MIKVLGFDEEIFDYFFHLGARSVRFYGLLTARCCGNIQKILSIESCRGAAWHLSGLPLLLLRRVIPFSVVIRVHDARCMRFFLRVFIFMRCHAR